MNRPIKIMRIIARLNVGGPAIHVTLLSKKLDRSQFQQTLVYGQLGELEGDMGYLADEQVEQVIIPALGREISPFRDLYTLYKLVRLMRKVRPDIVHTHTAKAGFVGRTAAWLAGVPVRVHTFHGHVFHGYFGKLKTRVFLTLERLCARISTKIIAISPRLLDELTDVYKVAPREKFTLMELGLDLKPLREQSKVGKAMFRKQFNIPMDKRMVGIVGRLVPIKNHELFLDVVHLIAQERDDIHFLIVGDGERRALLEAIIKEKQIGEHVTFTGWQRDIQGILYQLDVLALTSNNEGTPVSIIEAMAAGVPVVSTEVGGVADVLGNGQYGRLVPPDDPATFAITLMNVIDGNHPDLSIAQEASIGRYDISRLTAELDTLYRTLLKST